MLINISHLGGVNNIRLLPEFTILCMIKMLSILLRTFFKIDKYQLCFTAKKMERSFGYMHSSYTPVIANSSLSQCQG